MKTRVLMFGWEFPPHNSGGLGVACQGLTRAMAARGIEIVFVMPKKLGVGAPWARFVFADTEVEGRAVNSILKPYVSGAGYSRALHDIGIYGRDLLGEVRRYALIGGQIAKEEQFDVVYAHDWLSFGAGIEAKRVSGKPLIVHVHATEFDRCGGSAGVNAEVYEMEKQGMEAADRVIAVSQYTKDLIVRYYGIPESKIRVVHNGIDEITAPDFGSARNKLTALKQSGYHIVLFLGRVTLQKGPDYFLKAARSVLMREPKTVFFLSGSGDMERQIMDMAASLGISDRVLFTGFLRGHERTEVYKSADLFVMPSVSEPFGITALEAMKAGTPVLVSKQSGVAEAVRHALKVDFWDVDEMTNKILGVIRHKGLRQSLSENGRREVDHITWEDAAGKVENVLQE
ncbi:MAG TPA: glycosyltransferase family 4 protein, partial [Candidatus Paceibacterota bacterium]|nr:glycosyltransferase family 4 protein [Candidatus Paceibacterota bacterium]